MEGSSFYGSEDADGGFFILRVRKPKVAAGFRSYDPKTQMRGLYHGADGDFRLNLRFRKIEDGGWFFGVEERKWTGFFDVRSRRSKIEDGGVLRSSGSED